MQQSLFTIAEFPWSWEAHIAKNVLAEHGIRSFIGDEHSSAMEGMSIMVSAKLQVAAEDRDRARAALLDALPPASQL